MKTRLAILAVVVSMITACTSSQIIARSNVSIYTKIPLAPNVVLTVKSPTMVSPGPGYVWIDGYWTWDYHYGEYVWVQGYWTLAPYAGAFWIPGYWEYNRGGYYWIDARWLPRDYRFSYGYYNGRYDYYGRPVYYSRPHYNVHSGYAYAYDNRPEYRSKGYSSSSHFNNAPRAERNRITREYQQQTRSSVQPAATTDRNRQENIRIRDNNGKESSTARPSNTEGSRTSTATTPSRNQPDNNRQSTGNSENSIRNSESKSTESRSSSGNSRTKESNNSSSNSSRSSSSSSSGSGRR